MRRFSPHCNTRQGGLIPRLLLLVVVLATVPACRTTAPLAEQVDPELLAFSDERRMLRKERAETPLEERIAAVEADLERTLVPIGDGALAPRYLTHDGEKGSLHLEHNVAILSALAARYKVTGDEETRALGETIIRGIKALDAATGELDGFVPLYVGPRSIEPSDRTTHSNMYTQLLFAYVMAGAYFGRSEAIEQHVSLIYQRFVDENFALRHVDGSYVAKADVGRPLMFFNARRTLDRRILDHAAYHLGDEETRELARRHRWCAPILGPMHIRFFTLEVPTPSSSWLNLQAMTALTMLGESHKRRAVSLARRYERDNNPFFRILAAMNGADEDLEAIRRRLEEFPYPATSTGIINSHRDDVTVGRRNFVKFHATPEAREPLPLYEVRSSMYLWKTRMREVDSMPQRRPNVLLGHDLLQAYWLLRVLEEQCCPEPPETD